MFFGHRSKGQLEDCLQYLFNNDIIGPSMPIRYFNNRLEDVVPCSDFLIGEGSTICLNYPEEALKKAIQQFSSIVKDDGQNVIAVAHDDVGLSQESYEAPPYDLCDDIEAICSFNERNPPPDDQGVPEESMSDNEEDRSMDGGSDHGHSVPLETEIIADDVMQQTEDDVQAQLEQQDVMRMPEFAKRVKEGVSEQLDLLLQYSRSGNVVLGEYDLHDILKKCLDPILHFRLQMAKDIANRSEQNLGQKHVSSNCVNPTKRRRVMGSKWGITQFNVEDND